LHVGGVTSIDANRKMIASRLPQAERKGVHPRLIDLCDNHRSAQIHERLDGSLADTGAAPRDERHFTPQSQQFAFHGATP
jgi:hypothetical protein